MVWFLMNFTVNFNIIYHYPPSVFMLTFLSASQVKVSHSSFLFPSSWHVTPIIFLLRDLCPLHSLFFTFWISVITAGYIITPDNLQVGFTNKREEQSACISNIRLPDLVNCKRSMNLPANSVILYCWIIYHWAFVPQFYDPFISGGTFRLFSFFSYSQ